MSIRERIQSQQMASLRMRALTRLTPEGVLPRSGTSASAALGVLHDLASSPATAVDALTLLHELQVHQVELELQDEELRASRAELEKSLSRQFQLYDYAPVGCYTVDRSSTVLELNLTGARLLGYERELVLGQPLASFLAPRSARELHALLAWAGGSGQHEVGCSLELLAPTGKPHMVQAAANGDPSGTGFLVAFIDLGERDDGAAASQ